MPTKLFSPTQERDVCEYYWTRQNTGFYPSYVETAEHFGCSPAHVRNLLKKHGYERRTQAETRERRPCKPITNLPDGHPPTCKCGCGQLVAWNRRKNRWNRYVVGHYRPKHSYHDPEWLRVEYIDKNRTLQEIANQFSVGKSTIKKAMNKAGILTRTTGESLAVRESMRSENNPAWKGGCAQWEYSHDWKSLARKIRCRDEWTCQRCGEQRKRWGVHLHVHHIDGNKLNNAESNLISLCAACHALIHAN